MPDTLEANAALLDVLGPARRHRRRFRLKPLTVDAQGFADLLGKSRSWLWGQWRAGNTPLGHVIGGTRLFSVREIRAWIAAGVPSRSVWMSRQASQTVRTRLNQLKPGRE
jgi:hypothetical protein